MAHLVGYSDKLAMLLSILSGNEYKVLVYLILRSDDYKTIHNITREEIEKDCKLGYVTVYNSLATLKKHKYIEYSGQKQFAKILL